MIPIYLDTKKMICSWNSFVLAISLLQLSEWCPWCSLLFAHGVQARDKQKHCEPEETSLHWTLLGDRHSPDLSGAGERWHGKDTEVDIDINTAKATESGLQHWSLEQVSCQGTLHRGGRRGGKVGSLESSYAFLLVPPLIPHWSLLLRYLSVYLPLLLIPLCQWRSCISVCTSNLIVCLNTRQI